MYDLVKEYYGQHLQSSDDLKTSACCDITQTPSWLRPLLSRIHPEVLSRYYGCGLVCPDLLDGCHILDLGSGSGRDVYALAQMVGESGSVVGVDMTKEQLAIAENYRDYHSKAFGYSNVTFKQGYIEKLDELELEDNLFDVIVSNCVINLSPDKDAVLREVYRLLKPGGEFYFSDVYSDRRVPEQVHNDPVLYGECLGGALYWNDFQRLAHKHGFADVRLVESHPLEMTDPDVAERVGDIQFFSATYRLFKIDDLESACEDYGQSVVYHGSIPNLPDAFTLDEHHIIATGQEFSVCGNTWLMLKNSRFNSHFEFLGDFSEHRGIFKGCGTDLPFSTTLDPNTTASCC